MSTEPEVTQAPPPAPGSTYRVLAMCSLGVIALVPFLFHFAYDGGLLSAMVVVVIGALGVAARWRAASIIFVLLIAFIVHVVWQGRLWSGARDAPLAELLLCASILCYCVSHYRMLGFTVAIFPQDSRQRAGPRRWEFGWWRIRRRPRIVQHKRPAAAIATNEVALLLMALPACALMARVIWNWLEQYSHYQPLLNPGLPLPLWHLAVLTWGVGVVVIITKSLLGWWRRYTLTPEQATLLLQDTVWKGTRREQRLLNSRVVWRKRRRQRREDRL